MGTSRPRDRSVNLGCIPAVTSGSELVRFPLRDVLH
jgi:hypothetical protein